MPVTCNTPPTFLVQAEDDNVDGVKQSLVYYTALAEARVPVEMYLYAQGAMRRIAEDEVAYHRMAQAGGAVVADDRDGPALTDRFTVSQVGTR